MHTFTVTHHLQSHIFHTYNKLKGDYGKLILRNVQTQRSKFYPQTL